MPPIDFTKTENLVFEGGGGKGVVYLGVVKALECMGLLPLRIDSNLVSRDHLPYAAVAENRANQVQRIAGSSAGAITAFMLSMGCTASQITNELVDAEQFLEFFDLPIQISRNHRDGTEQPRSKRAIREVAYQNPLLNRNESNHERIAALKGTEIEIDSVWLERKKPVEISDLVMQLIKSYFNLDDKIKDSDFLTAIMERNINEDEWENYEDRSYTRPRSMDGISVRDPGKAQSEIEKDYFSNLQIAGGFFPGLQVRLFFHRLILRYLYKINNNTITQMLSTRVRNREGTAFLENYIKDNFTESAGNVRIERFMKLKTEHLGMNRLQTMPVNDFVDLLVNINFREFFYITGVDLMLTGTNITRMMPRVFSHTYTPMMPVCEAVGISMNIPVVFCPVILRGNIMDEKQYETLIKHGKADKLFKYTEYNKRYKGAYADGGLINNYPIQLVRNEPRYAFAEFVLPENRFNITDSRSINKSIGFRLIEADPENEPDLQNEPDPVTDRHIGLQDHISLFPYLRNTLDSMQYYTEIGQLIDKEENDATIAIFTGKVGTLDFSPKRRTAQKPIWFAFWKTLNRLTGAKLDKDGKYEAPNIAGSPSTAEIRKHAEELKELIDSMPG